LQIQQLLIKEERDRDEERQRDGTLGFPAAECYSQKYFPLNAALTTSPNPPPIDSLKELQPKTYRERMAFFIISGGSGRGFCLFVCFGGRSSHMEPRVVLNS
jgi:hypothetical protein